MPPSAWPCTRTGSADAIDARLVFSQAPRFGKAHPAASAQIGVSDVLLHHALGVEERSVDGNGVLHNFQELGAIVVVHRKNYALQLGIQRFGFGFVIRGSIAGNGAPRFADAPSGDPLNVAFHPPAVENAQARDAIQRGLHAAGAGSFERKLRRVEPEVHAGSYLPAELKIVVVEENHGYCFPQRFFRLENPANDVLPASIIRMRLAGINNLEVAGVLGNLPEPVEIGQDQVGALVSCCAARKPDGESLGIELEAGLLANRFEQIVLGDQMRRPDILRWQPERAPQTVVVLAPRRNVAVEELLKSR